MAKKSDKPLSKTDILNALADATGQSRKEVGAVLEALEALIASKRLQGPRCVQPARSAEDLRTHPPCNQRTHWPQSCDWRRDQDCCKASKEGRQSSRSEEAERTHLVFLFQGRLTGPELISCSVTLRVDQKVPFPRETGTFFHLQRTLGHFRQELPDRMLTM
jgi:hypothetical protein